MSDPMDGQTVPVNMYEAEGAVVVVAPFPGVMEDDVQVSVEGNQLRIRAEMRTPAPKDYLLHEWHYGPWDRTVDLPDGFGPGYELSFGNGQLAVRVLRS
jgi:HSP20 family protein